MHVHHLGKDALPVKEATGLPFSSTATAEWDGKLVPAMHACGHDALVTIRMGVADVLVSVREQIAGTVMLVIQPGEEGCVRR